MKEISYGHIAAIREQAIVNWALKTPGIQFSPSTVCKAVYKDIYPNGNMPPEAVAGFTIACMDLQQQGILKLEKVLERKKATVNLYTIVTHEERKKEDESEQPTDSHEDQTM